MTKIAGIVTHMRTATGEGAAATACGEDVTSHKRLFVVVEWRQVTCRRCLALAPRSEQPKDLDPPKRFPV